ncbi:MAG: hypothetical protein JNL60_18590 [Bacteroidia bacterium]|nr:hypothetical protein [Bacteroidia bacterium]
MKTELACNYGECITTVEIPGRIISLFLLDWFFVEIHIDHKRKKLLEVNIQDDPDILYAYLGDLDISGLLTIH